MTDYLFTYFTLGDTLSPSSHSEDGEVELLFVGSILLPGNVGTSITEISTECNFSPDKVVNGVRLVGSNGAVITSICADFTPRPLKLTPTTTKTDNAPTPITNLPASYTIIGGGNACSFAEETTASISAVDGEMKWVEAESYTYKFDADNEETFPHLVANAKLAIPKPVELVGLVIF